MTKKEKVKQEVETAYADLILDDMDQAMKQRNLDFRASEELSPAECKEVLSFMGGYNDFTPNVLDKFPADSKIVIAREGSVCLYARGKGLPSKEKVCADEKGEDGPYYRYWWD